MTRGFLRAMLLPPLLMLAGCQGPSYGPAPVVDLEPDAPKRAEVQVQKEPETPAPPPASRPNIPEGPRPEYYTVKSGDTLVAIGLGYGLSHRDIALWNGIANPDVVKVGQRLRLTPPNSHPVATPIAPAGSEAPAAALAESGAETTGIQAVQAPGLLEIAPGGTAPTGLPSAPDALNQDEGVALRPQTTFAGESGVLTDGASAGAGAGLSGGSGLVKTGPLAEGFAYNAAKLRQMRAAWDAQNRGRANQTPKVARVAPPAEKPVKAGGAGGGPEEIRRAFGIEWSWPARGELLLKFTESSRGWDIGGNAGDAIHAAADGKVIYAGSGIKGFGRLVIVKHDNDYLSAYAHNRRILKEEGAQVRRGEVIAEMGDSGAERTKLHFEIRKAGKPTDPAAFLPENP